MASQITSLTNVYPTLYSLRVTGLCAGNSPVTSEFPHKRPVKRKMFPFYDVIMWIFCHLAASKRQLSVQPVTMIWFKWQLLCFSAGWYLDYSQFTITLAWWLVMSWHLFGARTKGARTSANIMMTYADRCMSEIPPTLSRGMYKIPAVLLGSKSKKSLRTPHMLFDRISKLFSTNLGTVYLVYLLGEWLLTKW